MSDPIVEVYTYVRTELMKVELTGLAEGTINSPLVEKVIDYGIQNEVLDTLILFLHDDTNRVHGEIRVKIDWKQHNYLASRSLSGTATVPLPEAGTVQASSFRKLIACFNDYAASLKLRYWFNVIWTGDGEQHDAICGIKRSTSSAFTWLPLEGIEFPHPFLEEMIVVAGLHIPGDTKS